MRLNNVKPILYISIVLLFFGSCKKKRSVAVADPETPVIVLDTSVYKCEALPPAPIPFGWHDTTTDVNKNINCFMYNPANPNEVVIVVNGDVNGYNKMFCYNIPNGSIKYLASLGDYLPSINKYGWIVYSTNEYNIYKIKCNGDSLAQLTFGSNTKDPKWDYTDNYFYFYQAAFNNVPSQLMRSNPNGSSIGAIPLELPYTAVFHKSDKIVYQKTNNNTVFLVIRDMKTYVETNLISGPYNPKSTDRYFDNLCVDNSDESIYWANSYGIFRCTIAGLKIDTVLKNCENVKYDNPVFQIWRTDELLLSVHLIKPLLPFKLLHEYKALTRNLRTREMIELKVFN